MNKLEVEKRENFMEIFEEIAANARIIRADTQDGLYVMFLYHGLLYYLESCPYYPFTDDNHPGLYNYIVYKVVGMNEKRQMTYWKPWNGIDALNESDKSLRPIPATQNQPIDILCNSYMKTVSSVVGRHGTQKQIESLQRAVLTYTTFNKKGKECKCVIVRDPQDETVFFVDVVNKVLV